MRYFDFGVTKMKNVEKIGKKIYDILHSEEFKERHRMQEKDFTGKWDLHR